MKRMLPPLVLLGILLLAMVVSAGDLGKTLGALDGRNVAAQETTLGNFVADAIRQSSGADVAIVHAMAFRGGALIEPGVVTEQAILKSLAAPSSKVTTLQLTPAQLAAVMQRALAKYPEQNMAFVQFSGMDVRFNSKKTGTARLEAIMIKGKPIDLADTKTSLTVAMPSQLALGGAGYVLIFTDDVAKTMKTQETTLMEAITQAFAHQSGVVTPKLDGRLQDTSVQK